MAEIVDPCCVSSAISGALTKPDKNNNTTANLDDGDLGIITSEQCDLVEDGTDEKSESTDDSDDRRLSSGVDDDGTNPNPNDSNTVTTEPSTAIASSSNDETEVPITTESPVNHLSTSTTNVNTPDPYKDFTGVDTESFITTTLRNNPKDRALLLRLELLFQQFIKNEEQTSYQFQAMNSYERMIVHRVAAFFGLDHNIDKNGQAVVVTKTSNTRIPDLSFQKCIPEDESNDLTSGASTTDNPLSNSSDIPTRRILRRHEKNLNHEHSQRNGVNEDFSNSSKHQPSSKPYSERVNHYAETRARIFNDTSDPSNSTATNKNLKTNQKQHSNFVRPSYRKQQPQQQHHHQNSSHQHRSYSYQHAQPTSNNHVQQYPPGKTMDPSSHMLNNPTARNASLYSAQPPSSANMSLGQAQIYASMIPSNPTAASLRTPTATSFYNPAQPPSVDYDYKQPTGGAPFYNYVSMIPPGASNFIHQQQLHPQVPPQSASATASNPIPSQHGAGIPLPILVHQPTGQIQYIFSTHALQQQQQQQAQQPPPPNNPYPLTPDGQFVPIYRQDNLSIQGPPTAPPPAVVDSSNTHHHQYSQNQPYHHSISQQAQQQQQQQAPPSQSTPAPQPPPFVRIYPSGTPGNLSHPYAPTAYQPPQTSYIQPGAIPAPSFMMPAPPPQTAGGVQTYPPYDNGVPYNAYGPSGKSNVNNNGVSVQYATNHLSALNLQNQHDDYQTRLNNNPPPTRFSHANSSTANNQQRNYMGRPLVQSSNGSTNAPRMNPYSTSIQPYRFHRPGNNLANTDKPISSIENDPKSLPSNQQQQQPNSDNISLAGPAQE